MAVSQKHNKPVLPRTTDGSDLGSNRASIYSGKGLSFDGVNDYVQGISGAVLPNSNYTICSWFYMDTLKTQGIISWGDDATGERRGMLVWNGSPPGYFCLRSSTYASNPYGTTQLQAGVWYFGAVTVDSSGNASIYLNGELDGTGTNTLNAFSNTDYIVGNTRTNEWMDGKISSPKVFDVVLTAAQIKELYENPEQSVPTGVSPVNLKLHLAMTEGAGSYVYNANANAIGTELISNAGFDETCQKWGTTDSNTVEIAGGKAIWTNAPLSGSFVEQPLDLEVGKFYRVKFDYTSTAFNIFVNLGDTQEAVPLGNGTYVKDMYYGSGSSSLKFKHGWTTNSSATVDNVSVKEVVPNFYNGTINGATRVSGLPEPLPQTALMDWNKYQRWNGSQMVTIGSSTVQTVRHSFYARVTLEALNSDTNLGSIIFMNYSGTGTIFSIRHDAQVQLRPHCSTNGSVNLLSGETISLGRAYDLVGVIDGSYAKIYIDGILIASAAHTQTTIPALGGVIGSWSSTNFGAAFDGIIHQVAYFDRALTPEEIYKLYSNELNAQDISDYIHSWRNLNEWKDDKGVANGTLTGTPLYGLSQIGSTLGKDVFGNTISKPRASGAYNFDGLGSYVSIPDNSSITGFSNCTIEGWFKLTGDGSKIAIQKGDSDTAEEYTIDFRSNLIYIDFGGGSTFTQVSSTQIVETWYHVVGTIESGSTIKLYVNGSLESTKTGASGQTNNSGDPLYIGARWYSSFGGSGSNEQGQIANPRIYNYALTAEQVADNFNEKASTFGGTKVASELDAYIERTASDGATVEAHSCLVNYLTELDKK